MFYDNAQFNGHSIGLDKTVFKKTYEEIRSKVELKPAARKICKEPSVVGKYLRLTRDLESVASLN